MNSDLEEEEKAKKKAEAAASLKLKPSMWGKVKASVVAKENIAVLHTLKVSSQANPSLARP